MVFVNLNHCLIVFLSAALGGSHLLLNCITTQYICKGLKVSFLQTGAEKQTSLDLIL